MHGTRSGNVLDVHTGEKHGIRPRTTRRNTAVTGGAPGRPPVFDAGWYTKRNTVERCFSKLKQFRAAAR